MYIKKYDKFSLELLESMSILKDTLLSSINAEEVNSYSLIGIKFDEKSLDTLSNNSEFIESISRYGYIKSEIFDTIDYETFLDKNFKFLLLTKVGKTTLDNPDYILIEDEKGILLYKINGEIRNFYDKLSSKVIEIIYKKDKYIYKTSIKNEWVLQTNNENDYFTKIMREDDLFSIIKKMKNDLVVNII